MRTHITSPRLVHTALLTLALAAVPLSQAALAETPKSSAAAATSPSFVVTAPWALEGNYRPQSEGPPPKWQPPALSDSPVAPPLSDKQRKVVQDTRSEKLPEPT